MDLFVLDSETWKPKGAPFYKYDSLIWTERYFGDSEFELKSLAVDLIIELFEIETLVGIRQSDEVMMVEEMVLDTDDQGREKITIRGRSLSSYIRHRVVGELRSVKYAMPKDYTNLDAGLVLLYNSLVNNTSYDYTKGADVYFKNPKDAIPNSAITCSTDVNSGDAATRWITPGPIDGMILDWFSIEPFGFRVLRPTQSTKHISIDASGNVIKTDVPNSEKLCFDVFSGIDRTFSQSDRTFAKSVVKPVILDVNYNDLRGPNYLRSVSNLKTEAHIGTDTKALFAYNLQESDPPYSEASGLARRVIYLDGGEPEEGSSAAEFEADVIKSAQEELSDYIKVMMVDGSVSPESSVVYGSDYFLGDVVSIRGRYGAISNYRVTEFIRTKEGTAEESYPTLEFVE